MKFVLAALVVLAATCSAQVTTVPTLPPNLPIFNITNSTGNGTVIPPPIIPGIPSTLILQLATCPLRDQIRFLNQILSVEYISQAYLNGLIGQMDRMDANSTVDLGVAAGAGSFSNVKANVTLILNQVNQVISWLNDTVRNQCSQLPTDDRAECYVFAHCNYTFGNLTNNWPNSTVSNSSSNVSAPSNSTGPVSSYAIPAFQQATVFSDRDSQFMIAMVPLMSNSTQQQQLTYFSVMHGQHASYFRKLTGGTQFVMAPIVTDPSNANLLKRSSIRSGLLPFVADQNCCDGFRGVRRS